MTSRNPWNVLRSELVSDPHDGPLPGLIVILTFTTGVIDATSVLGLGRVFVANMTGNVVFLGLALARAPGFALSRTVASLVGFVAGAASGRVVEHRHRFNRATALRGSCVAQVVLITTAVLLFAPDPHHLADTTGIAVILLLAMAMGIRNAMTRHLAVPGLATNVLTTTLTSIAGSRGRDPERLTIRQVLTVLSLLLGALLGAELVFRWSAVPSLLVVLGLLLIVIASCQVAIVRRRAWRELAH